MPVRPVDERDAQRLTQAVADRGADRLKRHTIRLARVPVDSTRDIAPEDLSGTGVLIARGDKRGIITAAHNVLLKKRHGQNIDDMDMYILLSMYATRTQSSQMEGIKIPLTGTKICGGKCNDGSGPDIGWIPLSVAVAATIETRSGVFYRMDDDRTPRIAEDGDDAERLQESICGYFVSGFSTEWEKVALGYGEKALLGRTQSIGQARNAWTDQGWDYERRCIDMPHERKFEQTKLDESMPSHIRRDLPPHPEYMGGLSGAGLWCLWQTKGSREDGGIAHQLCGMVYFQDKMKGTQGEITMINHGEQSIKRIIDNH